MQMLLGSAKATGCQAALPRAARITNQTGSAERALRGSLTLVFLYLRCDIEAIVDDLASTQGFAYKLVPPRRQSPRRRSSGRLLMSAH
jgi:hypothetical protein